MQKFISISHFNLWNERKAIDNENRHLSNVDLKEKHRET